MKEIPGNLPLGVYHAIASREQQGILKRGKRCLIGSERCGAAINSHSIPVASLARIAERGHVYAFSDVTHEEQEKIFQGQYAPRLHGINQASTYKGFCNEHDTKLFWEIESRVIDPTDRQVFLLHFRADSFSFCSNSDGGDALRALEQAKRPEGHNPEEALSRLRSSMQAQKEVFADLQKRFARMLSLLDSGGGDNLEYQFIRLSAVPDIMCSTLFVPIYDIDGRFLLPLATPSELQSCQTMSVTISSDSVGGYVLLVWNDADSIASEFAGAFADSGYDLQRLIPVLVAETGNVAIGPTWWRALDDDKRKLLMYFASVLHLDIAEPSHNHRERMYQLMNARRQRFVDWRVASVARR